jgi:hypothetical protein
MDEFSTDMSAGPVKQQYMKRHGKVRTERRIKRRKKV